MKVEIKPASQEPTIKFPCLMEYIETWAIYLILGKSELYKYVGFCLYNGSNQLLNLGDYRHYLNPFYLSPFKGSITLTNGN